MKKEGTEEGNKPNNRQKVTRRDEDMDFFSSPARATRTKRGAKRIEEMTMQVQRATQKQPQKKVGVDAHIDSQNKTKTKKKLGDDTHSDSKSRKTTRRKVGDDIHSNSQNKKTAKRNIERENYISSPNRKNTRRSIENDTNIDLPNKQTGRRNIGTDTNANSQNKKTKRNIQNDAYITKQSGKISRRQEGQEETSAQGRKPRTKRETGEMREKQNQRPRNKRELKEQKRQDKKEEKRRRKQEKKERRKKSVAWKIFKILVILLILAGISYGCYFAYRVSKNGGGLQGFMATALGHDENTLKDLDPIHFMLVGISGEEEYKLADTIMVCSYNPKTQKASILSIPRDTYVGKDKTKASASYKINAVYRNGENIEGMVEHLENLTELEIDNYLVIDTKALVQLVDALGGVTFNVPIDMDYDDPTQDLYIHLKAGEQKLNGKQAEGLVRFRHSNDLSTYPTEYGDNDLGRMRTQREFIMQVMKQTVRPENLFKLIQIAEIGFKNITTNMTFDTVKDYLPYAVNFNAEDLKTSTLPGEPELTNKVWIYTPNIKQTKALVEELFVEERIEEEENEENTNTIGNTLSENTTSAKEESIKIELLNGSGNEKNLTKAIERLEQKGYEIVKKGNTKTTNKTTIVNRSNREEKISKKLKQDLKAGTISKKYNNSQVDYTITLGKDYK